MVSDHTYMNIALEAALKGAGWTRPNPLVGAVIVKDGEILSTGWHEKWGGPHAEVNALRKVSASPEGATMYVTLEPCSHHGKTPPCCEAIVRAGIKRVVCPLEDPNPLVGGKGFAYLREHGVQVEVGLLEEEARKINSVFLHFLKTSRPFVTVKTAMSLDGKIATATGNSRWISSVESRAYVHTLRHENAAIAVGVNTLLSDDSLLTTRLDGTAGRNPLRIVFDSTGRTPLDAQVFKTIELAPLLIISTQALSEKRKREYEKAGAEVLIIDTVNSADMVSKSLSALGKRNIDSLLVEGGGTLIESFVRADSVDRYITHIAPMIIGGKDAPSPVGGEGIDSLNDAARFSDIEVQRMGEDIVVFATVRKGNK